MLNLSISIATGLFTIWFTRTLFVAFFSPLAAIPNAHFTAPFSGFWLLWMRYKGQESEQRLKAHQRHGSIIRLGPTELGVNCIDNGVRTIYGGNFDKTSSFANLSNYGFVVANQHLSPPI